MNPTSSQSVPLYRRQVLGSGSNSSGSNSNTQSTSTPDIIQHDNESINFMDSLFNNKYIFDYNSLSSGERRSQIQTKTTTYAEVLNRQNSEQQLNQGSNNDKDPFAAIRELCQKTNGIFNNNNF